MHPIRTRATAIALVLAALMALSLPALPATAKLPVDQHTLIPQPPPGADCRADGNRVICHTAVVEPDKVNEPLLELPCGTVYETSTDVRRGIRWYDASSRTIVKRFVSFDLQGAWSLSPAGAGPAARIAVHAVSRDVSFPDPEDPDSWPTTFYGAGLTVQALGYGVIALVSHEEGYGPDEDAHGVGGALEDPEVASELCAALGG